MTAYKVITVDTETATPEDSQHIEAPTPEKALQKALGKFGPLVIGECETTQHEWMFYMRIRDVMYIIHQV